MIFGTFSLNTVDSGSALSGLLARFLAKSFPKLDRRRWVDFTTNHRHICLSSGLFVVRISIDTQAIIPSSTKEKPL